MMATPAGSASRRLWLGLVLLLVGCKQSPAASAAPSSIPSAGPAGQLYLGFDRNAYPGDSALTTLKQTFAFAGYWLTPPPGEQSSSWLGKREKLESAGFGFLVIARGRLARELGNPGRAAEIGARDAQHAATVARQEGFPAATIVFVDQEQGGRMLPEQVAYLLAWFDAISANGFHPGVYCSAIAAIQPDGSTVITAEDIRAHAGPRPIAFWVYNDFCPPAPGCVFTSLPPLDRSGASFALVWQFAESPREIERTLHCASSYDRDGSCYPPQLKSLGIYVDLDLASSPDPSHARP